MPPLTRWLGRVALNKFFSATCEQSNNKCSAGRLHKCSECQKWGCKAIRHTEQRMQSLVTGLPTSNEPAAEKTTTENQENVVFGLPAVTNTAGKLKECHILWTPVVSAGEKLPLPLDSCCSVSLVSRSHADYVASKSPHLKYQSLETPVTVSVADANSQLKAVGTMEIPIQWSNGRETTFQMFVVPRLSYLEKTICTLHKPWWIMGSSVSSFVIPVCFLKLPAPLTVQSEVAYTKGTTPMLK